MKEFYYLNLAGEKVGPIPLTNASAHNVTAGTMVWLPGMVSWQRAAEVPAIMAHIAPPTPPQPQMPPQPQTPPAPGYYGYAQQQPQVLSNKPDNYMWLAILTTVLCSLPFGIVSIVYASKVNRLWSEGNHQEAQDASNKAKLWGIISAGVALFFFIICLIAAAAA